jgi:excinuclease UvrABC ATPase subunit
MILPVYKDGDNGAESGSAGGRITASGSPAELAAGETPMGNWLRSPAKVLLPKPRDPVKWMIIRKASRNNLKLDDLQISLGVFCGILGVSDFGKHTYCGPELPWKYQSGLFSGT